MDPITIAAGATSSLASALVLLATLGATTDARAVAHTDDGATWVGTTGGLVRVEAQGARTETIGTAVGLPDATVRALLADGATVWAGTDRGLAAIDVRTRAIRERVATDAPVTAIARDGETLWIGTLRGVSRRTGAAGAWGAIEGAPAPVGDLVVHEGIVYVASPGEGVRAWDGTRWSRLGGDRLAWDLEVDGDRVLVATSDGLFAIRGGRRARVPESAAAAGLPVRDLRAVRRDGRDVVVGTCGAGAFRLRGRRSAPIEGSEGCVAAIDTGGARGVVLAGDRGARDGRGAALLAPGLPDGDVSSLARDGEDLWIGTFRAGLARVRGGAVVETFDERSGLVDDRVNRLAIDGEGDLWIATDRGVVERDRASGRFALRGLLDRHATLVAWDGARIVAASGQDAYAWDAEAGALVPLAIGPRAQDVARAADGALAVATAEGLVLSGAGARRVLVAEPGGLPDDWITALAPHEGALAIGTYNAGVSLIAPDGSVRALRDDLWVNAGALASVELAGRRVLAAGTLDDGLWLWDGTSWARLGTRDGLLPDDDVTAVLPDGEGGLWVATRGGIAHLAPAR